MTPTPSNPVTREDPVCCYCDASLSCSSCGMEQPYDDISVLKYRIAELEGNEKAHELLADSLSKVLREQAARIAELESNEKAYEERIKELLEIVEAIPGTPDEIPDEPCSELCGNPWCNDFGCIPEKIMAVRALQPKEPK